MNPTTDFELERRRMNQTYEKLNMGNQPTDEENHPATYWTFLKLRIGFSILLLFFLAASVKAFDSPETKNVQKVLQQIDQKDPYTQKILSQVKSFLQ